MRATFQAALALGVLARLCTGACAQTLIAAGEQLYEEHCSGCHGEKLKNTGTSFDLRRLRSDERSRFDKYVMEGKGQMPPWRGTLNEDELNALWAYVRANSRADDR
ncbi:MAG TPA: cytochrome c [Pseudomonadota bacterium]|nr:cytochrome c [Pseudomonadota bacterium]